MSTELPPPGPERDRLVAEALGYALCTYEATGYRETRNGTNSDFCRKCGKPCGSHRGYPSPSTSNHAALDALEAWRAQKPGRYVVLTLGTSHNGGYEVVLGEDADPGQFGLELAPTLADAASAAIIEAKRREG